MLTLNVRQGQQHSHQGRGIRLVCLDGQRRAVPQNRNLPDVERDHAAVGQGSAAMAQKRQRQFRDQRRRLYQKAVEARVYHGVDFLISFHRITRVCGHSDSISPGPL